MESATHVVPGPWIRQSMSYRGTEERALQNDDEHSKDEDEDKRFVCSCGGGMRLGRLHGQKLQGFLSAFVTTPKGATWCSSICSPPMLLTQISPEVFNGGLQWHQFADGPCYGRPGAHSGAPHSRLEEQEEEQGRGWSGAAGGSWAGAAGDDW